MHRPASTLPASCQLSDSIPVTSCSNGCSPTLVRGNSQCRMLSRTVSSSWAARTSSSGHRRAAPPEGSCTCTCLTGMS
eukprot:360750-Chlamydomonas_euryale.AAC.8